MKRTLSCCAMFFMGISAAVYIISSAAGLGKGAPADISGADPMTGSLSGFWAKIYSSNPAMDGADGSFIPQTGPATANPYLRVNPRTSGDCIGCHFSAGINFASSEHMKGSVTYEQLKEAADPACLKCHDIKTCGGEAPDTEASARAIFPGGAAKSGMAGITCIGCHGTADGRHYAKLNFTAEDCASCHDKPENCGASRKNPAAGDITANYKISSHAAGVLTEKFYEKTKERNLIKSYDGIEYFPTASCLACHQNLSYQEYFAQKSYYADADGNKHYASYIDNNSAAFLETPVPPRRAGLTLLRDDKSAPGILCQTCHDVHRGGFTRKAESVGRDSSGNPITNEKGELLSGPVRVFSEEFNLCTQCHAVELDYIWDPKNNRFDYTISRSSHDNTTGMADINDLAQRTVKITGGKPDASEANTFDYDKKQGAHVNFNGGSRNPIFADQPWRMVLDREKTIIDTHFKGVIVSEMAEAGGKEYILKREYVKGYNINAAASRPCGGCHDPHLNSKFGKTGEPDTALIKLAETWAASAHADYKSKAFNKNDFDAECMKCHSGYEAAKVTAGTDDLKSLDNVSSILAGTMGEPVTCVACHDLTAKEIINGKETYKLGEARKWKYDTFSFSWAHESIAGGERDVIRKENLKKIGSSVSCYNCHDGVRTGRMINAFAEEDKRLSEPFDRKKQSPHYGPAASVTWGNAAYEFPGKEYDRGGFPRHKTNMMKKGGVMKTPEETAGEEKTYIYACADCHEFSEADHSGKPLIEEIHPEKEKTNEITGINMTDRRKKLGCGEKGCHGEDGTEHAKKMEANRNGYFKALEEVKNAFEKKYGLKLAGKSFIKSSEPEKEFTRWGTGQAGRNLYGAASNIMLLSSLDKGAYSHNPIYVKQLLWDMMEMAGGSFSKDAQFFVNPERP